MDRARLTREESACARGKRRLVWLLAAALAPMACGGATSPSASSSQAPSATPTPTPTPTPGPPTPLSGATITVLADGFHLDAASAKSYPVTDLHVFAGSQLLFINADTAPHDILSDPLGLHNDCPEINTAGFLVPGQQRATIPLTALRACGFHDHDHEGDTAFGGRVTIEPR